MGMAQEGRGRAALQAVERKRKGSDGGRPQQDSSRSFLVCEFFFFLIFFFWGPLLSALSEMLTRWAPPQSHAQPQRAAATMCMDRMGAFLL